MAWQPKGIDYDKLHAVLRAVLPHHRAISTRLGGEVGVFKGIDSSGNVWLIRFDEPFTDEKGHTVQRRAKKLELKAEDAEAQARGGVTPIRMKPRRDVDPFD